MPFVAFVPFCGYFPSLRLDLLVDMLGFNFQLFFTGFAHPMVFSVDKGVVVDAFSVVFDAEITLHRK
jgi:hypothetical protein